MTDSCGKRSSTPLQKGWTSSDDSSRAHSREIKTKLPGGQTNTEDTETESPDVKSSDKSCRTEEYAHRTARHSNVHAKKERIALQSHRKRREKRGKRSGSRRVGEHPRTTDDDRADSRSSAKRYGENSLKLNKSQRRKKNLSRADDEMPITEILKKTQETARTRYEKPVPLPELTSDRIYIQGRSGFSTVKIGGSRRALRSDTAHITKDGITDKKGYDSAEAQSHMLIKVAIMVQNFWKCTGLVYQGLLGGMALLHFIMIHVFFNTSMKFVLNYSIFSEVYTNTFSFLIVLCVISIFDKFDLARLDVDHLREIYMDHAKTAITIPLYLITFGLHQATAKIDDQLFLTRYHSVNGTTRSNNTMQDAVLDNLQDWQKITMSKDLLAVFAWLFVTLGTRDNMLSMYLESMDKYASNVESPG